MIRHIAMFTFTNDVTAEDVRAIDEGLAGLPGVIKEIRGYSFGSDLGFGDGNYDYAVIGEFGSAEDFHTYSTHPVHVQVLETRIKPVLDSVARIQIDLAGD